MDRRTFLQLMMASLTLPIIASGAVVDKPKQIQKLSKEEEAELKIEGYLAWKWGVTDRLPAGHKYKNNPPSFTVKNGH